MDFTTFLIFLSICPGKNYKQIYNKKSKASLWRNLSTGTLPKFFSTILYFVPLVYNPFFSRRAFSRKLFDIRFSYNLSNFSHVCLLVRMASKTVTRSVLSVARCSELSRLVPLSVKCGSRSWHHQVPAKPSIYLHFEHRECTQLQCLVTWVLRSLIWLRKFTTREWEVIGLIECSMSLLNVSENSGVSTCDLSS